MQAITRSLTDLAIRQGIDFKLSTEVQKICVENNRVIGVEAGNTLHKAEVIVCNSDVFTAYRSLLSESLDTLLNSDKPYLLEIVCEKEENVFPMVPAGGCVTSIRLE
jgi:phytoene dehydrogenase-like protein